MLAVLTAEVTHSEDMTEPEPGTSQASPPHYRCVAALLPGQHTLGLIPRAQHICEQGHRPQHSSWTIAQEAWSQGGAPSWVWVCRVSHVPSVHDDSPRPELAARAPPSLHSLHLVTFVTPRDSAGVGDMLKWSVGSLDSSHTSVHSPAVAALGRAGAETNIDQSQLELQTIRRLLQSRRRPLRGLSWGENVGHCSELRHIQDDFVSMDFQYSKIKL